MDEIMYQKSYSEYKAELDGVLQKTAEGFVKIGYLLKVARDTNILAESGYRTVAEFAKAEYNLDKTQVSRFMAINDKFSEGGYADRLAENYQGYGYAKLTIMLQLPDAVNEELTPEYSKAEIQAIKDEFDEEEKISDLEVMIEQNTAPYLEETDERYALLYKTILQLGEDEPELYLSIFDARKKDLSVYLPEIMAPSGDKMYSTRVKGVGRIMLTINETSDTVKLINSRSGEKESYTWADIALGWSYAGAVTSEEDTTGQQCWEKVYGRKYPVAPVQQNPVPWDAPVPEEKPTPKKETKVTRAPEEWKSRYKKGQQVKTINGKIGELLEKTGEAGQWKIRLETHDTIIGENDFEEYIHPEPHQTQLNDTFKEVPKVEDTVENTGKDVDTEWKETQIVEDNTPLPGQINITDYKNVVPAQEEEDQTAEKDDSDYHPGKDLIVDTLLERNASLGRHIMAKEWKMALMDIDTLAEDINRAKAIDGMKEIDE